MQPQGPPLQPQFGQQPQIPVPPPPQVPWYYQKWFVILMVVLIFPLGLILLWKSPVTKTSGRIVWTTIVVLAFLASRGGKDDAGTPPTTAGNQAAPAAAKTAEVKATDTKPATQPTAAKPPDPYNFTPTDANGVKYKGKLASNVGVAILKIEAKDTVGNDFTRQKADGKFVLVAVVVANYQKDAVTVDSNGFKILANGKEYSGSVEGSTALEMSGVSTFFLKQLNPDMSTTGWLIFDVPKTLDLDTAQLQFKGGFTGRTETLPLKPIIE